MTKITKEDLANFTGTETWYRHPFMRNFRWTDGIQYLADNGAEWLVIAILSHYKVNPKLQKALLTNPRLRDFALWELKLNGKGGCTLTCRADTNEPVIVAQKIKYTDFPFDICLYVEYDGTNYVLLLPSEH